MFDIAIVTTYFTFGRKEFAKYCPLKNHFIPWSILIFAMSFALQYSFLIEFGDSAPKYSAFLQNLIMSVLFISMLIGRKSTLGQNQIIAVCKWLGTLAPTILIGAMDGNQLVLVLGILRIASSIITIGCTVRGEFQRDHTYSRRTLHSPPTNPPLSLSPASRLVTSLPF
jgi:hypothetical protein